MTILKQEEKEIIAILKTDPFYKQAEDESTSIVRIDACINLDEDTIKKINKVIVSNRSL